MPQVSADNDVFVGDCVNGPASQDHLIPGANKRIAMHSRLLFFLPDGHPTFRPDVAALFGEYLPRQGVTSDIVTTAASDGVAPPWGGGEAFLSVAHGGKVRGILNSTINNIKALLRLRRGGYGAVQVRDQIFIAPFALMGARLCGLPFFYWMSFPISESKLRLASDYRFSGQPIRWLSWVLRGWIGIQLLYRVILPSADYVFVQSEVMKDDLARRGLDRDKMYPVPMGIDPARFSNPASPDGASFPGRRVIGYLGVCSKVRRIDFLLDVMLHVRRRFPNALLLLAGDADEEQDRQWLREQISARDLDQHAVITGWLSPEDAQKRISEVEVALALMAPDPLLNSTSPTKLVEYLALGLPVVANEHPEQQRVLRDSGAGLTTPFEPSAFADAVTILLDSPETRARMALRGREYALNNRSYAVIAAELAEIYEHRIALYRAGGAR